MIHSRFAAVAPLYRVRAVEFSDGVPIQSLEIDVIEAIPHRCPGPHQKLRPVAPVDRRWNLEIGRLVLDPLSLMRLGTPEASRRYFFDFAIQGPKGSRPLVTFLAEDLAVVSTLYTAEEDSWLETKRSSSILIPGGPTHSGIRAESPG